MRQRVVRFLQIGLVVVLVLGAFVPPAQEAAAEALSAGDGQSLPAIDFSLAGPDAQPFGLPPAAPWDGAQWAIETVDADSSSGEYSSLAIDGNGHLHVSYYDGAQTALRYAYWGGTSWVTETVDNVGDVGQHTSLALDAAGDPHIAYYDYTGSIGKPRYAVYSATEWVSETLFYSDDAGRYISLALDGSDRPHVSYLDNGAGDMLRYATKDGSWDYQVVDATSTFLDATSLALDGSGAPHIAYRDNANNSLRYASLDAGWTISDVTGLDGGGYGASLALEASGTPHIVYSRGSDFKILRHVTLSGTTWISETVDGSGDAEMPSLALDAMGGIHIAYYEAVSDTLRYAYHDGLSWAIRDVVAGLSGALYPSLALDAAGYPHITYYHDGEGLKHAWLQPCTAPGLIDVQVPEEAFYGPTWVTATVEPPTATLPLTFIWHLPGGGQAVDVVSATESAIQVSGGVTGTHVLTVTAENCGGTITATTEVEIVDAPLPDLVLVDVWPETGGLGYQVMNAGPVTASAGHVVAAYVDGSPFGTDVVAQALGPGERADGIIAGVWSCSGRSDTVLAVADRGGSIGEADEGNNTRQETWPCLAAPVFTYGPTVTLVTEDSAVIEWWTDQDTTGEVQYSARAGRFDRTAPDVGTMDRHRVTVSGLASARVYQARVRAVGETGLESFSAPFFIETAAVSDTFPVAPPVFQAIKDAVLDNYTLRVSYGSGSAMGAQMLDPSQDIERVEFYVDHVHVATDYEGDDGTYEVLLAPHSKGWTSQTFYGPHQVTAKAYSWAGVGQVNPYLFEPQRDSIPVDLAITFPPPDFAVLIAGDSAPAGERVDIMVEARQYDWQCTWNGGSTPIQGVAPDCGDVAYAVEEVQFLVDNQVQHTSYPSTDQDFWHGWTFDLEGRGAYPHTVRVRAFDSDYQAHQVETTIHIVRVESEPALNVTRNIAREGNLFRVQLTVENDADATGWARVSRIKDYVEGFQVVPTTGANYAVSSYYNYWMPHERTNTIYVDFSTATGDYITLSPGESKTVEYLLVPVLYDPHVDFRIGGQGQDVRVYYETPAGDEEMRGYDLRVWLLQSESNQAVDTANYLLATHPQRLGTHYGASGMNDVLSEMARLASLKNGVLGYLQGSDNRDSLDALISSGGAWNGRLSPAFDTIGEGYMLIVGETEIIESFYVEGFELKWAGDTDVDYVQYSDHPYSDTGGSGKPELIVGRILGDSAGDLVHTMETSINVHLGAAGYGYDRSYAVLLSGTGNAMDDFQESVEDTDQTLTNEGWSVSKTHWEESPIVHSYPLDFERHDAFASGDVDGDGDDELIVADRGDRIYILDENGSVVRDFHAYFDSGDTLAVGDMNGDGIDEIVIGDQNDAIEFYDQWGNQVHWVSFNVSKFDDLAVGDLTGDGLGEIILGDRDDQVVVLDIGGNPIGGFAISYQAHDGLAVGNVHGGAPDEIVLARQGFNEIRAYDINGTQVISYAYAFQEGDTLGTGNVWGDASEELLIVKEHGILIARYDSGKGYMTKLVGIPADTRWFDGIAVRTAPAGNEIWWMSREDNLVMLDRGFKSQALQALNGVTPGADWILFSGHGSTNAWGPVLSAGDLPLDLGTSNPVVFAPSCLTGNYQAGNDQSLAEAFLENGAGAYIGSTEISPIGKNIYAIERFLALWSASETIGKSFLDLERDRWGKGDIDWWEFWISEYNLYGDPKFGDPSQVSTASAFSGASLQQTAVTALNVTVPDYVVTARGDGYVNADLPGGELIAKQDEYRIPYWSVSLDYAPGQRVQDVVLTGRTSLVTDSLALTTTQVYTSGLDVRAASGDKGSIEPSPLRAVILPGSDAWTPDPSEIYAWQVVDNPDGSSTLLIEIYAFHYQPLTQKVAFYKDYGFDIEVLTSTVSIEYMALDRAVYDPGDSVSVTLWLSHTGPAEDVTIEATVRDGTGGAYVDGLTLRTLHSFSGTAVYAMGWDSTGTGTGYYALEVALRDDEGQLLDRKTEDFFVGMSSVEVVSLDATPELFHAGDTIDTALVLSNTGSMPVTGTAIVRVQTEDGSTVVATYTHAVENLAPGAGVTVEDAWDSSGASEETYLITGYMLYESKSTPVESITVSTQMRVYLPLVLRNR